MIHITHERLSTLVTEVFVGAGAPPPIAQQVAESLVRSNLMGHDSHGVLRVGYYVSMMERGALDPRGEISAVRESATTALLDGGHNFGQVVMRQATQRAMSKATAHDLGMVAVFNSGHTGRLGEWVVQAAERGFMGLIFGTAGGKGGCVAPYLGTSRMFNTNPIAWAVPALKHPPVFFDFATSVCAQGKIMAAIDKGTPIPEGWLLDADGNPTTDPKQQRQGGVMLPFGKHKGYGLSFLIELLGGGLTGTSCAPLPAFSPRSATVMMVVNIAAFQPLAEFRQLTDDLIGATKKARKAPGVKEILVPGEPEWRTYETRLNEGIDLPDASWQRIVEVGARHGVTVTL